MTRKLMNFASLLKLNVSKKRRGIRSGADLLDTSLVSRLTKRKILSQVNFVYCSGLTISIIVTQPRPLVSIFYYTLLSG